MAWTDGYITQDPDGDWQYANTGGSHGDTTNPDAPAWARVRRFDDNNGNVPGAQILVDGTFQEGPIIDFTTPAGLLGTAAEAPGARPWIVWAGVNPMSLQEALIVWNKDIVLLDKSAVTGGEVISTVGRLMIVKLESPISINGIEHRNISFGAGCVGIYKDPADNACNLDDEPVEGRVLEDQTFDPFDPYEPECERPDDEGECLEFREGVEDDLGDDNNGPNLNDGLIFCDMCNPNAQCGEWGGSTGQFAVNNAMTAPIRCTTPFLLLELKICECCSSVTETCELEAPVWLASMVVFGSTLPMEVRTLDKLVQIYPCDITKGTYLEEGVPGVLAADAECCEFVDVTVEGTAGPTVTVNGRWKGDGTKLPGYQGQAVRFIYHCVCDPCAEDPKCNACDEDDDCVTLIYSEDAQCWVQEDIIKPTERVAPVSFFEEFSIGTTVINLPSDFATTTINMLTTASTQDIQAITAIATTPIELITDVSTYLAEYVQDIFTTVETISEVFGVENHTFLVYEGTDVSTLTIYTDYGTNSITFDTITAIGDPAVERTLTGFDTDPFEAITDIGTDVITVPVGDGALVSDFTTDVLSDVPYDLTTAAISVLSSTANNGNFNPVIDGGTVAIQAVTGVVQTGAFTGTVAEYLYGLSAVSDWIFPVVGTADTTLEIVTFLSDWEPFTLAGLSTGTITVPTDLTTTTIYPITDTIPTTDAVPLFADGGSIPGDWTNIGFAVATTGEQSFITPYVYATASVGVLASGEAYLTDLTVFAPTTTFTWPNTPTYVHSCQKLTGVTVTYGGGTTAVIDIVTDCVTTTFFEETPTLIQAVTAGTGSAQGLNIPLATNDTVTIAGLVVPGEAIYSPNTGLTDCPYPLVTEPITIATDIATTAITAHTLTAPSTLFTETVSVLTTAFTASGTGLQIINGLVSSTAYFTNVTLSNPQFGPEVTVVTDLTTESQLNLNAGTAIVDFSVQDLTAVTALTTVAAGTTDITAVTNIATGAVDGVTNIATEAIFLFTANPEDTVTVAVGDDTTSMDVVTDLTEATIPVSNMWGIQDYFGEPATATVEITHVADVFTQAVPVVDEVTTGVITFTSFGVDSVEAVVDPEFDEVTIATVQGEGEDVEIVKIDGDITLLTSAAAGCDVKYKFLNHDGEPMQTTIIGYTYADCPPACGSDFNVDKGTHPLEENCENFLLLAGKYVNRPENRAEECPCYSDDPAWEYGCEHPSGTESGPVDPNSIPEWDSEVNYGEGDIVQKDGVYYKSTTDDNLGNDPAGGGGQWEVYFIVKPCTIRVNRLQRDWCKYCY